MAEFSDFGKVDLLPKNDTAVQKKTDICKLVQIP